MKWIILMSLGLCITSCNKKGDLTGIKTVKGTAFRTNPYWDRPVSIPYDGLTVKIRYEGVKDNYLYSTKTDLYGNFVFTNLSDANNYEIFADTMITDTAYYGQVLIKAPFSNTTLTLTPDAAKNSIVAITVLDVNGSPVNNASMYRFINRSYWEASATSGTVFGSIRPDIYTDNLGRVIYFNLPTIRHYFYSTADINGLVSNKMDFEVPLYGITDTTLTLH